MVDHHVLSLVEPTTTTTPMLNFFWILLSACRFVLQQLSALSLLSGLYTYYLLAWRLIRYKKYGLDGVTHRKIPS